MERQWEETMEWERKQGLTARQVLPRRDYREAMGRGNGKREDRAKKGTQTGANGSPRGVDDRHEGDLRIIHCDGLRRLRTRT